MSAGLRIVRAETRRGMRDWLTVPQRVHAGDPAFVRQIDRWERRRVSSRRAPLARFGEIALFLAYRGSEAVGRISAQVNRRHLEYHRDAAGHFGFFDCHHDEEAARALVAAAAEWLVLRGSRRMTGPINLSLNEAAGCLVKGFDTPPAILMPHARPFTGALLEAAGLAKEIDLLAYRVVPSRLPGRVHRAAEIASETQGITIRRFDMRRFSEEMQLVADIYQDAWRGNWGFVPFSPFEISALIEHMAPLLRDNYGRFVCVNGKTAGMVAALPNLNELIGAFDGHLFPFNWARLLWLLERERSRTARIPLLGIRRAYQSTPIGGLLLALMIRDLVAEARAYSLDWIELSWILETNRAMVAIAEMAAGPPAKVYRLYSRQIGVRR